MLVGFFLVQTASLSPVCAQISEKISPYHHRGAVTAPSLREFVLDRPRTPERKYIAFEETAGNTRKREGRGPHPFGELVPVRLGLQNSGTWQRLSDGGRLWRLAVRSPDARSMRLTYEAFHMPPGATLHLYDGAGNLVLGAFTSKNNRGTTEVPGMFATQFVDTNELVLAYYEPAKQEGMGRLVIDGVVHEKKPFFPLGEAIPGASPSELDCHNNVNCAVGRKWQMQKNSVVAFDVPEWGFCSATLVNNENNDGKLYFFTAAHCVSEAHETEHDDPTVDYTAVTRELLEKAIIYWAFESEDCEGTILPPDRPSALKTTAGFRLLSFDSVDHADFNTDADDKKVLTDYALLEAIESPLNLDPPMHPYFSGWDRKREQTGDFVVIHHPQGNIKKISFGDATNTDGEGQSRPFLMRVEGYFFEGGLWYMSYPIESDIETLVTHYWLHYTSGASEGGSSGSPLFNSRGYQIGLLSTGSFPSCEEVMNREMVASYSAIGKIFQTTPTFGDRSAVEVLTPSEPLRENMQGRDTCNIPALFADEAAYVAACGPTITEFEWDSGANNQFSITLDRGASALFWVITHDDAVRDSNQFILRAFGDAKGLHYAQHQGSWSAGVPVSFSAVGVETGVPGQDVFIHFLLKNTETSHFSRVQSFPVEALRVPTSPRFSSGHYDPAGLVISPNPAQKFLSVSGLPLHGDYPATIYTPSGHAALRTILSAGRTSWDVSALPAGVYVLQVQNPDAVISRRWVKK